MVALVIVVGLRHSTNAGQAGGTDAITHRAVTPPSIDTTAPVAKSASSPASQAAAPAISPAVANRLSGTRSIASCRAASRSEARLNSWASIGVLIGPGHRQLTRTDGAS